MSKERMTVSPDIQRIREETSTRANGVLSETQRLVNAIRQSQFAQRPVARRDATPTRRQSFR